MIVKWRASETYGNFGDELTDVLAEVFTDAGRARLEGPDLKAFLIGSTISDAWLNRAPAVPSVYWGCGYRGEAVTAPSLADARFHGVRGFDTRDFLASLGHHTEMVGDTAFLLPLLIARREPTGRSIFVPHLLDPDRWAYTPRDIGVDEIIQPEVEDRADVVELVQRLSGASFVLGGAMHAAIVACAYGRPFGLFARGYLDAPAKYRDFLSSIGLAEEAAVHGNRQEAERWYERVSPAMRPLDAAAILRAAPAEVKPELLGMVAPA